MHFNSNFFKSSAITPGSQKFVLTQNKYLVKLLFTTVSESFISLFKMLQYSILALKNLLTQLPDVI